MAEAMDIDDGLKTTDVVTGDEFFDAEENVPIKDDTTDFLKKLDIAISSDKTTVILPENEPVPSKEPSTNGDKENGLNDSLISDDNYDDYDGLADDLTDDNLPKTSGDEIDEKLEEDLLKDLDDDNDLESVEKEVEDLLTSAVTEKEIEKDKVVETNDVDVDMTEHEDEPAVPEKPQSAVPEEPQSEVAETDVPDEVEKIQEAATKEEDKIEDPIEQKDKPQEDGDVALETEPEKLSDDDLVEEPEKSSPVTETTEADETAEKESEGALETEPIASIETDPIVVLESEPEAAPVDESTVPATEPSPTSKPETSLPIDEKSTTTNVTEATKAVPDDVTDEESKADDLLVACESPAHRPTLPSEQQDNESVTSSSQDDTPEESSDEKQGNTDNGGDECEKEQEESATDGVTEEPSAMDVDESTTDEPEKASVEETPAAEEEEPEKRTISTEFIPLKLKFVKHFSSTVGKLSRPELEELLMEKITESIMFCSQNTDLRARLELQETLCETLKKRFENVKKQYNDLEMIHNRVMKDLKDRPDAPITPVKITRAVGLQVYQPLQKVKSSLPLPSINPPHPRPSNKRPIENDPVNGQNPSKDNVKRKKTIKITPLRPPLSDVERANLDAQEARFEQSLRTNVSQKTAVGVNIPPAVTMTPISSQNGSLQTSSNSIDLTDEDDNSKAVPHPPALVAIRNSPSQQGGQRFVVGTRPGVQFTRTHPELNRVLAVNRGHPAPLPMTPSQISKPGMKKIPPRPTIKIQNVPNGIIVSWTVDQLNDEHADIHSYQIYAYEETTAPPNPENWRHVGDVKALLLPMAVTLTQFQEGQKYFFAVRAMDKHKRLSNFSAPRTWV